MNRKRDKKKELRLIENWHRIANGRCVYLMQTIFKSVFVTKFLVRWLEKTLFPGYVLFAMMLAIGIYQGLYKVPVDVTQGEVFRIIYIHVPFSILSLGLYCAVGICSVLDRGLGLKLASTYAMSLSIIGAICTTLAIITGMIWAKPTWGTWWVWDARLTCELILLMLYVSYIMIRTSIKPNHIARKISSYVAIIGMVDVPFVHYSVEWWYTLHQGSTLLHFAKPKMPWVMLWPMLLCILSIMGLASLMVFHTTSVILQIEKAQNKKHNQEVS